MSATKCVMDQFNKTALCSFHIQGKCTRGAFCKFAHSKNEIVERPNLTKTSLCKHWCEGSCNFSASTCQFAHGVDDLRSTPGFFAQSAFADVRHQDDFKLMHTMPQSAGGDSNMKVHESHILTNRESQRRPCAHDITDMQGKINRIEAPCTHDFATSNLCTAISSLLLCPSGLASGLPLSIDDIEAVSSAHSKLNALLMLVRFGEAFADENKSLAQLVLALEAAVLADAINGSIVVEKMLTDALPDLYED